MNTDFASQAAALEAEIEGLFAVIAAEQARTQTLTHDIRSLEMDLQEQWDDYERRYAWAFAERGLYPEIPVRWYPVIFRLIERLDVALTDELKDDFQFTQVKEKYNGLRVYYNADCKADSTIEPLIEQAESEVEHIDSVHKRLS